MFKTYNEYINEGKYDAFNNAIIKKLMIYIKLSYVAYVKKYKDNFLNETKYHVYTIKDIAFSQKVFFDLKLKIKRTNYIKDTHGVAFDGGSFLNDNLIEILINIDPNKEPQNYNYLVATFNDVVMHELIHFVTKPNDDFNRILNYIERQKTKDPKNTWKYFILKEEIPSMVRGLYKRAKYSKTSFEEEARKYLNAELDLHYITNKKQIEIIMKKWLKYYKSQFKF